MNTPTPDNVKTLKDIMAMQDGLKTRKDEIKESIKVLGKNLGCSAARVTTLINVVRKEETDPGTIAFEEELLEQAKVVLA